MRPTAVVSGQTQHAEGQTTFTLNKEPLSPIPLVMLLPVPSTSASESIQNPPDLNSDVSKTCLSARRVVHIPLPSATPSVAEKTDRTVLVKDMASPVSGSNILIPFASVKNGKTGWTLLEGPSMSGSVTNIYSLKKGDDQVGGIKSRSIIYITQLNAKNEKKSKVLSNLEILQVINVMKKNVFGDKRMENLSSSTAAASDHAEMKADDETQTGSRQENSNPSPEESSDAQLTRNIESESLSGVTMQPRRSDSNPSVVMLDSSPVNRQPEEDQIPKSPLHSSIKVCLNPDDLSSKDDKQITEQYPEGEDLGLVGAMIELGDESDLVQCETCGKMILEKDLIQHSMMHSDSSVPFPSSRIL